MYESSKYDPATGSFKKEYPRPIITADVILWCEEQGEKFIALILRGKEPFKDCYALPGGHFDVDTDEDILSAAVRELREELHVDVSENDVDWFDFYDEKGRDPRGRYVDHVYTCQVKTKVPLKAGDDAAAGAWFSAETIETMKLSFDHSKILSDFLEVMKED